MKKFNIKSEILATIALTCTEWICVFFAAAFALQSDAITPYYIDAMMAILWLVIAGFTEWVKYQITHNDTLNTLD